jgi:mannose-6-phosphate isomerase-like protein (cupin superfamily)
MHADGANKAIFVPAGKDRFGNHERKIWGLIPLATKLSAQDTGGALYVFEHRQMAKGGPPRHVHHDQDEWFYVVEGEFAVEVGDEKFRLKPGDSLFAPRKLPHAWAHVGETPGTLITLASPAGTFETFMQGTTEQATLPAPEEIDRAFAAHAMTVVGPPLEIV